jgi:hypothetical protein
MTKMILAGLITVPTILFAQQPIESVGSGTDLVTQSVAPGASASAQPAASDSAPPAPLTVGQKVDRRAGRLIEPVSLLGAGLGAGIEQWRDVPPQWKQGAEGYSKRFASAEGFNVAHNTVALGFDLVMHTDPRYHRMPEGAFKARLWNAVSQSFIANKDSGGKTINLAEIGGNFGAGLIANTWSPAGYNSFSEGVERGAFGFVYHTGKNVLREFMPDLLHLARLRANNS